MIRPATAGDVPAILDLRTELRAWLQTQGSDQWSLPVEGWTSRVETDVDAGHTWVLTRAGTVIGTITVNHHADAGLWTDDERADARFVHRMMLARSAAGHGHGEQLVAAAAGAAAAGGAGYLRLDAWTTNRRLHDYYRSRGWTFVRIADADTPSAALFERSIAT